MKLSPCGWYCFDEPLGWDIRDTPQAIFLTTRKTSASLEISSARRAGPVTEQDVWELQEKDVQLFALPVEETSMFRLPGGAECLQTICSDAQRVICLVYAYWGHYCVRLQLDAPMDGEIEASVLGLKKILRSLQPMTTD